MAVRLRNALILSLCAACGGGESATSGDAPSMWITEAEYQFGDAPERDVIFRRPVVRADPVRNRVFVVDHGSPQISAWSPEGSLLFVVGGRGEGPGEFGVPGDLFFEADGTLSVVDFWGTRHAYFTADGELIETALGPGMRVSYQGFAVAVAPPGDGVFVGAARIPSRLQVGADGVDPMDRQPLLRVSRSATGQWNVPERLLWLDVRNKTLALRFPDGGAYSAQPFRDSDQFRLMPGGAVVMRRNEAPGAVELFEVNGEGDTVWHRHLQFEPRRLTSRMVDDWMQGRVFPPLRAERMSRQELRRMYDEALYRPELPAAKEFTLAASGEVWLATHEVSDTLRTHYAVPRDPGEEPRRVLLPESLRVSTATATHVWGVRWDSLDVPHIVGRRLLPLDPEQARSVPGQVSADSP